MDDLKKIYREGEETTKEAWRRSDGDEDLADELGNAGDTVRREADEFRREKNPR